MSERMPHPKEDELRNMAINLVAMLRSTLNNLMPNVPGQSTDRGTRQVTPQESDRGTRQVTPQELNRGTRQATPQESDRGTRQVTPQESDRGTRQVTPQELNQGTRQATPQESDRGTRQATPQESDRGTRQATPQEPPGHSSVCVPAQAPSGIAVQQNMARCFPGLLKEKNCGPLSLLPKKWSSTKTLGSNLGDRCFPGLLKKKNCGPLSLLPKKLSSTKETPIQFFLLHSSSERNPKPSDELTLLQAGLGRRTINVPVDAGSKEITDILCETYPKMSELEGAWMLYKAMGGSGQRKLNMLSPEEEGYTGARLKTWAGGRHCLYIMPIQHTLDISPLPSTAVEFQAMPKSRCVSCQDDVPLQLLSLHVKTCTQSKVSDETHSDDIVNLDDDKVTCADVQPSYLESEVACPLCRQLFTKDGISIHASVCGKRSKKRSSTKETPIQFFLLHSSSERNPKPSDELTLLQAGLGRRTINVPVDAGYKEITDILCETYPKMSELEGAWMLYKAMGGTGQRKFHLLSPEEEGYTGARLKSEGRHCLYIMPIQHTLDISPLPFTAVEFQAMPKSRCVSCQDDVPLQLLSLHVKTCTQSKVSDEVACPLCPQLFTKDGISIHASVCGKRSKKRSSTPIQFFLLHSSSERNLKPSDELTLLQAGLGRRTINVPVDAGSKEITDILCETYPKLSELEGAWMLYKAMGGSGQRKLNLLSPEEEGYTGARLKSEGRHCLYIMPIQHTLDISPLPSTAVEFQAMPKSRCVSCQDDVPLQLLSLHVKTCTQSKVSDETHSDDIVNLDDDKVTCADVQPSYLESKVACPLCRQLFTKDGISIHASVCGKSSLNEGHADISENTNEHFSSLSDILKSLEKKVDTSRTFTINVTREDLFQRGLKQWARQKQASPKNVLWVSFIGENGIDQGALRKEFLTEMVRGSETRFFEGEGETGKNPKYSICDYQHNHFKTCGEIFATSVVQGGPAPNFLSRWCYHFLCHGEMDKDAGPDEVTDPDVKNLMKEVENAGGERLMELSDEIVSCGYTGQVHVDRRKAIMDAMALHSLVRLVPILSQLREGLRLYGLDEVLAHHHQMCQQLFVTSQVKELDADFLLLALDPDFSEEGSVSRQREMRLINFLQDFLQKLEDGEVENQEAWSPAGPVAAVPGTPGEGARLSVQSFFQWVAGQARVPRTESQREAFKITVHFDHDCQSRYGPHDLCYPIVNACAVALTFPTHHLATYQDFENNLTRVICGEFSRH